MRSHKVLLAVTALNVALVAVAWLGITGVQPGGAQDSPGVLQATGFDLVNDDGVVVAQLYVGEDGTGQVRLRDADGVVRVKLGASSDGSGLILFQGGDPEPGVYALVNENGTKIRLAHGEEHRVLEP